MTRDGAVDAIMRRLASRRDTQNTLKDKIVAELTYTQTEVLEELPDLPWFLLEKVSINTVANQEYADLDSDYLLMWDEDGGGFWRQNSDGSETQLKVDDWDVVKATAIARSLGTDADAPQYASVIGTRVYMRPIPDAVYALEYWQYGRDTDTDITGTYNDANGGNTNLWLTHAADWLIGETGAIVAAEILRDDKAASNFVAQATRAKKRVMDKSTIMEEQLKARQLGEI